MPSDAPADPGVTASNTTGTGPAAGPIATATPTANPTGPSTPIDAQPANGQPSAPLAAAPATQPSGQTASGTPTTQPAVAVAQPSTEERFADYESRFVDLSKQPLVDQKIGELTGLYQSIAKADDLSDTLKQVVQLRIATLQARSESQTKMVAAKKMEKDMAEKQLALQAEQQELQERLRQTDVQIFEAVGTLQASSLQVGSGTLYRLTDPGTGRTVIYIRSNDPKITGLLGQFIGVKGDPTSDPQLSLRVINPTDAKVVDPDKVNGSVAAEIIPPSMLAKQASASATN